MERYMLARLVQLSACSLHTKWYPPASVSHVQKSHARPPMHAQNSHAHTGAPVSQGDTKAAPCAQHPVQTCHRQHTCSHHISLLMSASQQIMHDTKCCIMLLNHLPTPHSLISLLSSLISNANLMTPSATNWHASSCSRSHLLEEQGVYADAVGAVLLCHQLWAFGWEGLGSWSLKCWPLNIDIVDGVTLSQSWAKNNISIWCNK